MTDFLDKYQATLSRRALFAERLEKLVVDILRKKRVRVHFTESRAKSVESLKEKIGRPGKSYTDPLEQVPDLVGVRIVLYYQDDVVEVGEILSKEFNIIEADATHQIDKYSPDQFGYLSDHFVIRLNESRATLLEWQDVADLHAEIQVRTVLQHSWAAVSHALQYKREGDVPIGLRRKLFRLAGLFELADEEFIEIREERTRLIAESKKAVEENEDSALIDSLIVQEVLGTSPAFLSIVKKMQKIGFKFDALDYAIDGEGEEIEPEDYLGAVVEELERLGIRSLNGLQRVFELDFQDYLAAIFADDWSVSEEFVLYLLLIAANPDDFSVEYLVRSGGWHKDIAERVVLAAENARAAT